MRYCEEYAALLDLYVDGELAPGEMVRVQAHLDECLACQAYVDDALTIRAAFPDAEDTVVPDGFADGVMARIQADAASKKEKKTPWAKLLVSLAACCAIVLVQQNAGVFSNRAEKAAATADCAASESIAMDTTTAETATESMVETAEPEEQQEYTCATSAVVTDEAPSQTEDLQAAAGAYASTVYLSADCVELLADYTPVEETAAELRYELTAEEYQRLLTQLEASDAVFSTEDSGTAAGLILVVVSK